MSDIIGEASGAAGALIATLADKHAAHRREVAQAFDFALRLMPMSMDLEEAKRKTVDILDFFDDQAAIRHKKAVGLAPAQPGSPGGFAEEGR